MPEDAGTLSHSHIHASGEIDEKQPPLLFEATYTGEIDSNVSGGLRRGARYLDNLDLVLEADMAALIGWNGAMLHIYGLYNNGVGFSRLTGDAQVTSNIETSTQALRLYEAWASQDLGKYANLKLGLYDLNSEFDSLDAAGLFTSSAHGVGTDLSQSGVNGPSIFPVTSLAARLDLKPWAGWHLRGAVLDGVPGIPERPRLTAIRLNDREGALLIAEVEAPLKKGKLLFGHWRYTAPQERIAGGKATGGEGAYVRGETEILPAQSEGSASVAAFARLGWANGRFYTFDRFASAGLNMSGPFQRTRDQIGIAVASAFLSNESRQQYRLEGRSAADTETSIEFSYRAQLNDALSLQPNVHYVMHPNAERGIPNAVVLGLRASITAKPF